MPDHLTLPLAVALGSAALFAFTNGLQDAALSTAALIATRAARPAHAMAFAAVFTLVGPLLVGAAVATTMGGVVIVPADRAAPVLGAGLSAATAWNLFTWRLHLPSSAGHALIGGLVGSALADAGSGAVTWGPIVGGRLAGVLGVLLGLLLGVGLGTATGWAIQTALLRLLRRASSSVGASVRRVQWFTSAALAATVGANDAQKTAGIASALLVAGGASPGGTGLAPILASSVALLAGMLLGGWSLSRTLGRHLFPLRSLDGLASQTASTAVLLAASLAGAPVSPSQVTATSIVGVGLARHRWHHVSWGIVRRIAVAWVTTPLAAGIIAVVLLPLWRLLPGG